MSESESAHLAERYRSSEYLRQNPTFHVERAEFKLENVAKMLARHQLDARDICDVGCGAGEVLRLLHERTEAMDRCDGYELSPDGFKLCMDRQQPGLRYFNSNLFETERVYDLALCLDVFEHVDDPFEFLRSLRQHASHFIFHIPLDLNVLTVLRERPLLHVRNKLGHLHYFTKGTALATLEETGHEVVDCFYTPASLHRPGRLGAYAAWLPRKVAFALHQDLASRLLGGFSLMVLTRPAASDG